MKFKNNKAEKEFKFWLDNNKIPYWYIEQDIDTFSKELKNLFLKRPDFFLLIPNFGFIAIDIKNKKTAIKYEKFFISTKEVEKYINLQRIFNIPTWFVISNNDMHYKTWFWIPVSKIIKISFSFESKNKNRECYSIPISEFIQVSSDDSMERVFSKFIKFI